MADFRNPCGGTRWRDNPDGTIEIEGRGVEQLDPANAKYAAQSWKNFEPEIRAAAAKRGVPLSWILAIMTTETGLWSGSREHQAAIASSCCGGPMAVMLDVQHAKMGGYTTAAELMDPAKNIDTGAAIIRYFVDQGLDLPAITARYNSGGLCCPNSPQSAPSGHRVWNEFLLCSAAIAGTPYPLYAIRANNTAVLALGIGAQAGGGGGAGGWILAGGLTLLGYALWTHRGSIAAVF